MQSYYIPAKIRCISGHQPAGQAADKEQTYQQSAHQEGGHGHTHDAHNGRSSFRQQGGKEVISHLYKNEMAKINAERHRSQA